MHNGKINHANRLLNSTTANKLWTHFGKDTRQPNPRLLSTHKGTDEDLGTPLQPTTTPQKRTKNQTKQKKNNNNKNSTAQRKSPHVNPPPRVPMGGTRGPQAAMGRGGRPDVDQAAMMRGGNTGQIDTSASNNKILNTTTTTTNTPTTTTTSATTTVPTDPTPINLPRAWTEEELYHKNSWLQILTGADRHLIKKYGDTIHDNDGTHLDGRINDDTYWQHIYNRVTDCNLPLCDVPSTVEINSLPTYTQLLQDVQKKKYNSEKLLIFAPCILRKTQNKKSFSETKPLIRRRLEAWKAGHYLALVKDIEEETLEDGWSAPHDWELDLEQGGKNMTPW